MPTGKYRDPNDQQFKALMGSGQPTGAVVSPSAPTPPRTIGDLWVDSDDTALTWDSTWVYPTLMNGWSDYAVGTYGQARYRRMPGGLVVIEGLVKGGTNNTPIFILAPGYRPVAQVIWSAQCNSIVLTHMYTYPTGEVQCNGMASGGTNAWLTLTTCHYGQ